MLLRNIEIEGDSDELEIKFRLSRVTDEVVRFQAGLDDSARLSELLAMIAACKLPSGPTPGFTPSGPPRVRFSARVDMEGAHRHTAVIASGESARTVVECQVISPSGEMHFVHLPLEFRAEVVR